MTPPVETCKGEMKMGSTGAGIKTVAVQHLFLPSTPLRFFFLFFLLSLYTIPLYLLGLTSALTTSPLWCQTSI